MPVVWLKLSDTRIKANGRPHSCPTCGSQILQRWGRVEKPVRDATGMLTEIFRYRCVDCGRTFRHYPEGVDRSDQSYRMRQIAGLAWTMGMSTGEVVEAFEKVGLKISRSSVWREGKRLAEMMEDQEDSTNGRKYAIDRNYIHRLSTKLGVVVALSVKNGREVVLGTLDEYNPRRVKSWIESLVEGIEIEVAVLETSTLDEYEITDMGSYLGSYLQTIDIRKAG